MMIDLLHGDCLEVMAGIPDGSVDMILCDLPYGTTACKWDTVIPFEPLWAHYKRVIKRNGAIVLTASQPFTTALIASNMRMFKYDWVWEKNKATGHLNANRLPMRAHEDVCVFSYGIPQYLPLMGQGVAYSNNHKAGDSGDCYGSVSDSRKENITTRYPRSVVMFQVEQAPLHPTQKPVALMEYLIRTYTNAGDTVLDNCMGSGTTGVACVNTDRDFIGIEKDDAYFKLASERIQSAQESIENDLLAAIS